MKLKTGKRNVIDAINSEDSIFSERNMVIFQSFQ